MSKIVVIGCGKVGMTYIFALMNSNISLSEIIMIDNDKKRLNGEVMDLCHTLNYVPNTVKIRIGDYSDCDDADIVCITAGPSQSSNDRLNDLSIANDIFKDIFEKLNNTTFNGIILVASNPLDVMSYLAYKYSNLPSNQVIGSGTSLDTSRLKYFISEKLDINPKSIHAYVIGEHGNSQFVCWSSANIANQDINEFLTKEEMEQLEEKTKTAAYDIIDKKGATYYGISMALVRITKAIVTDEELVLPVSNYDEANDVYISTACVIAKEGVKKRIFLELNKKETKKMQKSIDILKKSINKIICLKKN